MSGRVPWSRYSGSDIEQVAGIFICTERPDSMKIRPSQGDHGIDILSPNDDGTYDVYQVKCFTANLTANQKNQIQKSWDSLIEYSDKGKITVSTWYLVMPLDPTPENLEWINALTPTRTIKKVWYGETKMDAWAAQMPNIIDYCFRDGADETHKKIKEILTLSQKIDVTDGENLSRHLALIQDHLNHSDPSYQYNIAICSVFDDEKLEIPEEPSYVWQEIHTIDKTHQIQLTAFPKYQSATEIDPRRWKTTVMPRNKEQQDVFRRALDFGTSAMDIPITPPQTERDTFRLIPESSEIVSAQLSIFGRDTSDSGNTTDIYILLDNSSRFLIQQKHLFTGNRGKHWQGSDSTGVISIEFDMTPNLIENLSLHVNLRASIGKTLFQFLAHSTLQMH